MSLQIVPGLEIPREALIFGFEILRQFVANACTHKKNNKETCSSLLGLGVILHDSRLVALRALTHSLHAAFDSPPEFEPGMKALLNQSNMLVERHATLTSR